MAVITSPPTVAGKPWMVTCLVLGRKPAVWKSGVHDRPFYDALWTTLRAGRTWEGRFTNRRKDGQLFLEDASISPVVDRREGRLIGFVAVKRDVTRQVQLESQVAQAQKMEALGRLAGEPVLVEGVLVRLAQGRPQHAGLLRPQHRDPVQGGLHPPGDPDHHAGHRRLLEGAYPIPPSRAKRGRKTSQHTELCIKMR